MLLGRQATLGHEPSIAGVLRTRTVSERRGLMKMLIAKHSDEILGLTALGFEANELMVAVHTAMIGRLPYTMLRDAMFSHPTISEGLNQLLAAVPSKSTRMFIGVNQ